jgi:hypothetical protein
MLFPTAHNYYLMPGARNDRRKLLSANQAV